MSIEQTQKKLNEYFAEKLDTFGATPKGVTKGVPIKDVRIDWSKPWAKDHLKALTFSYAKAPHFTAYIPWLNSIYERRDEFLADFTIWLTIEIARKIGITQTRFMKSSELTNVGGQKTDRLIHILKQVGAKHYLTGPSARDYIEQEKFEAAGIALSYVEYDYKPYPQLYPPFDPFVTIFDCMFMTGSDLLEYI